MLKINEETNDMTPCMYPMCIDVRDEMLRCPEILNALIKSNLDDIVVSWTGMFLHSVYHIFKDLRRVGYNDWDNSLLFCGLSSQTMQLDWLVYSTCYGQYDLALRELRNILESAFLFYRADSDSHFKDQTLEKKAESLERLDENEKFGKQVFKKSGYVDWKNVYETLYKELCSYIHTAKSLENAKLLFEDFNNCSQPIYDKEKALKCIHCIQEVLVLECKLMESILKDVYGVENAEYASIFESM